uniref:Pyocin activator protein PrtN n=1 Tax=Schistosoma curassoni TaxID=6186 RepID=A0A183JQN5_9TREM
MNVFDFCNRSLIFSLQSLLGIPFPYNTPEQFEAFISQPICREWTTELTHRELTRPKVTVQSGRIIRPISKSAALLRDKDIERFVKQNKNS